MPVVGLVEEIGAPTIYAAFPTFEAVTGLGDATSVLRVKTTDGRAHFVADELDHALINAHLVPSVVSTRDEFRSALDEHFAVVTAVMKMIALGAVLSERSVSLLPSASAFWNGRARLA